MELAKQMTRLKAYSFPEDIDIKIVNLPTGEKIYEKLLALLTANYLLTSLVSTGGKT